MPHFTNLGDLIRRDRDLSQDRRSSISAARRRRANSPTPSSTPWRTASRARSAKRGFARGDRVAILSANRAEYPRRLLRHHARGLRRGAGELQVSAARPSISSSQDAGAKLVFCDRAALRGLSGRSAGRASSAREGARRLRPLPRSRRVRDRRAASRREPAMFLYTSGSTGTPKGVVLSHQSHIWVVETRLAPGSRPPSLSDRGAALSHERAGAVACSPAPRTPPSCCCRSSPRAPTSRRSGAIAATWLTAVPPMIAMMLREHDLLARTDLSSVEFIRMGSAPVSAEPDAGDPPRAAAGRGHQRLRHDRGRARWCSARIRRACRSRRCRSAIRIRRSQLRLVDGDNRDAEQGVLEMKCPALMNGYHNRPDVQPPFTAGRLLHHRRRVPPRRGRLPLFRRPHRRHVRLRRREHLSGRRRAHAGDAIPMSRRPRSCRSTTTSRAQKPVAFVVPKAGRTPSEDAIKRFALANAPAYQHPRFVWFVDELPLASTNKVDRTRARCAARWPQERVAGRVRLERRDAAMHASDVARLFHLEFRWPSPPASSAQSPRPCTASAFSAVGIGHRLRSRESISTFSNLGVSHRRARGRRRCDRRWAWASAAGANRPRNRRPIMPGTPCSMAVGISGAALSRSAAFTARMRILPAR